MTEENRKKTRRLVVAAFFRRKPPQSEAAVSEFLEKSIREALGGSVPGVVLKDVAELVAIKTDKLLVEGFGLPKDTEITETEWLTKDMSKPVSSYADKAEVALDGLKV
jgi:hypothetical protein